MTDRDTSRTELPSVIPIFPLQGVILLPDCELPLNIFEPRYLKMLDDARASHGIIGMVQPIVTMHGNSPAVYTIGCAGQLSFFEETADGRYLIELTGIKRFHIRSELSVTTPYRQIQADWFNIPEVVPDNIDQNLLIKKLSQYLETKGITGNFSGLKGADDDLFINTLSMVMPFEPAEKQALLEAETLKARTTLLESLLKIATSGTLPTSPPHLN